MIQHILLKNCHISQFQNKYLLQKLNICKISFLKKMYLDI